MRGHDRTAEICSSVLVPRPSELIGCSDAVGMDSGYHRARCPRQGRCLQQKSEDRSAPPTTSGPVKSHTEYLTLNIPSKMAFVNITPQVDDAVRKSGVREGLVLVNTMHITASVFINDDERGLHHDFG